MPRSLSLLLSAGFLALALASCTPVQTVCKDLGGIAVVALAAAVPGYGAIAGTAAQAACAANDFVLDQQTKGGGTP